MKIEIRKEKSKDYRIVEEITREAFWNLHVPGCDEHYLAHKLRNHKDFIPELDLVVLQDNVVIGNIMYSNSHLLSDTNEKLDTITFGPVSIHPNFQRQGIGSMLIAHSIEIATKIGHKAIIIHGNPSNYCKFGFNGSKTYKVFTSEGKFPCSLLVKELKTGILSNHRWRFFESEAYEPNMNGFEQYEATFEKKEKGYQFTQEVFSILSEAYIAE